MHIASLQAISLDILTRHLCTRADENLSKCLQNLNQNGSEGMFRRVIFKEMLEKYPSLVTDSTLDLFCHGNWKEVNIKKCRSVSKEGFANVIGKCTNVETLDISECDQLITHELAECLDHHIGTVNSLKMDGCQKLSFDLLETFVSRLPGLKELSCEGCEDLVIDKLFQKNLGAFNCLTTVNLSSCRGVGSSFIRHLVSATRSNIQSLNLSGTSVDCMALVYLSGYPLSAAVNIAVNNHDDGKLPLIFKPIYNELHGGCNFESKTVEDLDDEDRKSVV